MKKTRFLAALFFAAEMTAHFARGQDLVVDGGTTNLTSGTNFYNRTIVGNITSNNQLVVQNFGTLLTNVNELVVGFDGSSNSLVISNGGSAVNTFGYIGIATNSSNNSVLVTGEDSDLLNSGNFYVGDSGSSNSLVISNGGSVVNTIGFIGTATTSSNNSVLVAGTNSRWTNNSGLFVGQDGSSNSLVISNGGSVVNTFGVIGAASTSSNNSVLVTGTNSNGDRSTWTNSADLNVGYNGDSNSLVVSDGGAVNASIIYAGFQPGANHNQVIVGSNSTITTTGLFDIGHLGSSNSLVITNGGDVVIGANGSPGGSSIGSFAPGVGNSVEVTGPGSTLSNAGIFYVGFVGTDGLLTVSNQGSFNTDNLTVGNAGDSNRVVIADGGNVLVRSNLVISALAGATDNSVSINSGQLTVTNGTLNVGAGGLGTLNVSGGTVRVSNLVATNGANSVINFTGGTIVSSGTTISNAVDFLIGGTSGSGAEFVAQGGTHLIRQNLWVGDNGSGNRLIISNGGTVANADGYIGYAAGSSNNSVMVTGTNLSGNASTWSNSIITVGNLGSGNSLVISNGGKVEATTGGIGAATNSSNNSVVVTGADSRWTNADHLYVGFGGNANRMVISNGGVTAVSSNSYIGFTVGSSNNSVLVAGTNANGDASTWNSGNLLAVGFEGGGNRLDVSDGGNVSSVFGVLGVTTNSSENHVLVTGAKSTWSNFPNFFVGLLGSGNELEISNGGRVESVRSYIGFEANSSNNTVLVAGTHSGGDRSTLTNSDELYVGYNGSGNSLTVEGGAIVANTSGYIGFETNSSNNSVLVTGANSIWTNSEDLHIGAIGSSNSLVISNGGKVSSAESYIGLATNSSNNSVVVTGSGSSWSSAGVFDIGRVGSGNRLTLSDDGDVTASNTAIGRAGGSSSNSMLVTGAGSTWTDGASFYVGAEGNGNSLVVSNGGVVTSVEGHIGFWATASNNTVTVTGADSVWTSSNGFYVGSSGSRNTMTISDRGRVSSDFGVIGFFADSSNNSVQVTGTHSNGDRSTWTNSGNLLVGNDGSSNRLTISNGGLVVNLSGFVGVGAGSSNNTVLVTGPGSTWTNNTLTVGFNGHSNSLVISNGGEVANGVGGIGWELASSNNSVLVTGPGSTWRNSDLLFIGLNGDGNSLVISNGGSVTNTIGYVGFSANSSNSSVLVTGSGSTWTNSGALIVGAEGTNSSLTVAEGGTIAAASIVIAASNGSSGTFNIGRFGANGPASTIIAPTIAFGDGDGVINFNQSNTVTVSSVISGPGMVNQLGTGRTVLSGANTYTGPTTVSAGTLVAQSQTALGTGAVSLLGGTLELQSQLDIGSLLWDGAATIALPGAGAGQFLRVTGLLELTNGVNNFNLAGAALPRSPVKLLTSTNLPSLSTNDFGVLGLGSYTLSIDGDSLYLTAQDISYQSFAITPNQVNVAKALDTFIGASGDRGTVSSALDTLAISQYPAAFEQMMPSQYASLPSMAFNVVNALNSSLFQRLWVIRVNGGGFNASGMNLAPMQAEMGGTDDMGVFAINPSKDTKWSSFVDGNGVFANASGTGSVQNYRSQSGGVSTGAAYSWTDAFATGVYVGYQGLQAEYDSGKTIDNAVRFGVFGTYDIEDFYFNALVGGAYHGYTVNRYINFGGLDRTATGRPGAGEFNLALGTGYDFQAGDLTFGPFTTLQYTYLGVQGFTETGADALNLDVSPYDSSSLLYTLGAQAAYNWRLSDKVFVTPMVFAGWQHEFLQNGYTINSSFATGGPAAPFNYNTSSPARDNFYGGAGVTVGIGERWQATFIYSAFAANENNSSQNLYLGVGYKF